MYTQLKIAKYHKSKQGSHVFGSNKRNMKKGVGFLINAQQKKAQLTIQLRAEDPYERGAVESPQVHHIISHSKLIGGLDRLNGHEQKEVKRSYLPSVSKITIRQLYQVAKELTFRNNDNNLKPENSLLDKNNEWFDDMPWLDSGVTNLDGNKVIVSCEGLGFNAVTLTDWIASYNAVKEGREFTVGNQVYWNGMLDSYFEWSGGNLFYGAQKRVEPGGVDLDAFDEDAKYFRDPEHVLHLKQLAEELAGAGNNSDLVKAKLLEIGQANKDKGAGPKNDRSKWVKPKDAAQKQSAFDVLDSGVRADYFNAQTVYEVLPKQLLTDQIKKWSINSVKNKPSKSQVFSLYEYIYKNSPTTPELDGLNVERKNKRGRGNRVKVESEAAKINVFYYQDTKVELKEITEGVKDILRADSLAKRKAEVGV